MKLKGQGHYSDYELAIKNLKQSKIGGENRIDNEERILREVKNNSYLLKYFKYAPKENSTMMEYIDYTLNEYIYNKPFMTIAEVLKICIQVLESVLILHQYGVVHRDIKPSNFLMKNTESGIKLKVIDFGESTLTKDKFKENEDKKLGCTLPYSPIECLGQT
mgnify:CR=1 FL=1